MYLLLLFMTLVHFCSSQGITIIIFRRERIYHLLSCNVHGINSEVKRKKVINHFLYPEGKQRPDIFAFQETHSSPEWKPMWQKQFGKTGLKVLFSHGTSRSRGILLGFSETLNCKIISSDSDPNGQFVTANVKFQGEPFTVVALYLHPQMVPSEIAEVLATIMSKIQQYANSRVVMCGDFNARLDSKLDQAFGNRICHKGVSLKSFLETHDLTDIWHTGYPKERRFTSFLVGSPGRIDLTLGSPAFMTHVVDSSIGTTFASDHAPTYVDFSLLEQERGKGYWRLPAHLLADPVFIKRVENVIDETLMLDKQAWDPARKWDYLKLAIRSDSIKYQGECRSARKDWVKQLDTDIQVLTQARDKAKNAAAVQVYSAQIRFRQNEEEKSLFSHIHNKLSNLMQHVNTMNLTDQLNTTTNSLVAAMMQLGD